MKSIFCLAMLAAFAACGPSTPKPESSSSTASSSSTTAATPAASGSPQTAATCPAEGTPCTKEGDTCGADLAAKATSFSNYVHCSGGTWSSVEVPPPPGPQPSASASAPSGPQVELAWELKPLSKDPMKPKTGVVLNVRGAVTGRIDAGQLMGQCLRLDPATWSGSTDKPIAGLVCGWAGSYRNVGIFRNGNVLSIKEVNMIEEGPNPNQNEKVSSVGAPLTIPATASVTPPTMK